MVDSLRCPLASCVVTSPYGVRTGTLARYGFHTGLDLRAPTGTPVLAPANGFVRDTWWDFGGGRVLAITHSDSLETRYLHLSTYRVRKGDKVIAGDVIGTAGASGAFVTDAHLHLEVWVNGNHVDPAPLLGLAPGAGGRPAAGEYGQFYPVPEAALASLGAAYVCAPGYTLQGINPGPILWLNPVPQEPYDVTWPQAALAANHPELLREGATPSLDWRVACVKAGVEEGNQNAQVVGDVVTGAAGAVAGALGAGLLQAALAVAVPAGVVILAWTGIKRILAP